MQDSLKSYWYSALVYWTIYHMPDLFVHIIVVFDCKLNRAMTISDFFCN